jgi:hypothetical protein
MNNIDLTPEQEAALHWASETLWKFDPNDIDPEELAEEERRAIEDFQKYPQKDLTPEELESLRHWAIYKGYY